MGIFIIKPVILESRQDSKRFRILSKNFVYVGWTPRIDPKYLLHYEFAMNDT